VRLVGRLLLALVLATVVVLGVTAARVWNAGNDTTEGARDADAIIVLGAAQYNGRPQDLLTARLEHARQLFDDGVAPRVLTLGGKRPGDRFTEADAGQQYLVGQGVPADRVLGVGEGNDTIGSIKAAAALMKDRGWASAVVVTDPWHELRSTSMLRDQGVVALGSPTRTGPSVADNGVKVRYVVRETFAYLAYELGRLRL